MKMSDYKLVPVEPTAEMVEAAESAYMPFGDMEMAIRMALLAAPAVQLEPVGWQFYESGKWWNGDDRIKDHRKNTEAAGVPVRDVYAAPQPAEQQPACASQSVKSDSQAALSTESERQAPDVPGLTEALRQYQHNDGSGLVFGYDKLLVDQYVAGLVEALVAILEHEIGRAHV